MSLERYLVRPFDPSRDLDGAYRAFVSGFHHVLWPLIDHADRSFIEDAILTIHRMGRSSFVAEADGEARGILVGGCPFETREVLREVAELAGFCGRLLTGRHDMRPFARANMWKILRSYLPYLYRHPMSPSSETFLITSQGAYRGGIGRVMMDAWVAESRRLGYSTSTVGTDSELSWEFYERYGFTRVREFKLGAYAYSLPDNDVTGYVYSLDI